MSCRGIHGLGLLPHRKKVLNLKMWASLHMRPLCRWIPFMCTSCASSRRPRRWSEDRKLTSRCEWLFVSMCWPCYVQGELHISASVSRDWLSAAHILAQDKVIKGNGWIAVSFAIWSTTQWRRQEDGDSKKRESQREQEPDEKVERLSSPSGYKANSAAVLPIKIPVS